MSRKKPIRKHKKFSSHIDTTQTRTIVEHTVSEEMIKSLKVYKIGLARIFNNFTKTRSYHIVMPLLKNIFMFCADSIDLVCVLTKWVSGKINMIDYANLKIKKSFFKKHKRFIFETGCFILIGITVFACAKILNDYSFSICFNLRQNNQSIAAGNHIVSNKMPNNSEKKDVHITKAASTVNRNIILTGKIPAETGSALSRPDKIDKPAEVAQTAGVKETANVVAAQTSFQEPNNGVSRQNNVTVQEAQPAQVISPKPASRNKESTNATVKITDPKEIAKKAMDEKATEIAEKKEKAYELFQKGKSQADSGNIDKALTFFNEALACYPEIPELQYYTGIIHCRKGNYSEGTLCLERAYKLSLDPDILKPVKNAHFMLGLKQATSAKFKDADKSFSRVVEIDPNDGRAYFNRGVCRSATGNYTGALSDFNSSLANNYKTLELLFNKAVALEKLGKTENAVVEYNTILKQEPLFAPAHFNLAKIMEKKIDLKLINDPATNSAIYHYKRALEIDPAFYQAAFNIGQIFFRSEKFQASINWAKKCVAMKEDFPEGYLFLASSYFKNKSYYNALAQIEYMEKKGYKFDEMARMKGEIYKIIGPKPQKK